MTTSIPSRLLLPLLLSLLILCAACAGAPTSAIQSPISDAEAQAIHDSLRAFHAKIITAFNASDLDTLMSCVDERVIFVAVNNDLVQGRDAARAYFEKMLKGSTPILKSISTVMEPDGLSTLHSPSLAIAHGTATTTYSFTTGQAFTTKTRWTATVIRVQDQWKVISFQDAAELPLVDASFLQPE